MAMASEALADLRRSAIDIHRSFAALAPVIQRTRFVSLNALISSARAGDAGDSFGIIAQELNLIGAELTRLIREMEIIFREGVHHVAQSVKTENQCRLYRRSFERARGGPLSAEDSACMDYSGTKPVHATKTDAVASTSASFTASLAAHIESSQAALLTSLNAMGALGKGLNQRIDRINWVAVRQSHITAVAARIEAARSNLAGSGLTEVAAVIRELADDIASAESSAKSRVDDLAALSVAVLASLRSHGAAARTGGRK